MLRQEVFLQIQIILGFFSPFYISSLVCIVVFPACLCSEASLLPLTVCVILVLQGLAILRLHIRIQPGKKITHNCSHFSSLTGNTAFLIPSPQTTFYFLDASNISLIFWFLSEAFQRIAAASPCSLILAVTCCVTF